MGNIKSKIIPEEWKANIDEIMETQLFNANRYYAESNPNISSLMNDELYNSPQVFLERLINRWEWHNSYYELLLEPAYLSLVRNSQVELSPKEIDELIKVYTTSCLVDEATLVMSGVIKKYLDYNCSKFLTFDENLSNFEASQMLITPPKETFFAQYQIDHLYYIYLLKTNDPNTLDFKNSLMEKYHANDEKIFSSRFYKRFKKNMDMTPKEILQDIKHYTISNDYKIKHFYFTLEHPDRRAIRDIIIYDNLNEKIIAYNLIGISGFLLRFKILEYLNSSSVLKNKGYIYEYNKDIIVQALELLKKERMKNMDKDIKLYKQRGDTCAVVCMMMALEYYKIIDKANWYDERRFYKLYGSQYMSGTPFSALAYHFSKSGLDTTIFHSDNNLFNNDEGALSNSDFKYAMEEYNEHLKRAEKLGTKVKNGVKINADLLRKELQKGNIVIVAGEIAGGYHAILLSGYQDDKFIVCDPLCKEKQTKTAEQIESYMTTSIGKWFISVNNNTLEKRRLMSSLEKYEEDAINLTTKEEKRCLRYEKK